MIQCVNDLSATCNLQNTALFSPIKLQQRSSYIRYNFRQDLQSHMLSPLTPLNEPCAALLERCV